MRARAKGRRQRLRGPRGCAREVKREAGGTAAQGVGWQTGMCVRLGAAVRRPPGSARAPGRAPPAAPPATAAWPSDGRPAPAGPPWSAAGRGAGRTMAAAAGAGGSARRIGTAQPSMPATGAPSHTCALSFQRRDPSWPGRPSACPSGRCSCAPPAVGGMDGRRAVDQVERCDCAVRCGGLQLIRAEAIYIYHSCCPSSSQCPPDTPPPSSADPRPEPPASSRHAAP